MKNCSERNLIYLIKYKSTSKSRETNPFIFLSNHSQNHQYSYIELANPERWTRVVGAGAA
jgi:hypothetical protein